jgi:hypothetical protein
MTTPLFSGRFFRFRKAPVIGLLLISLFGATSLRAAPLITAGQLIITVQQNDVPQPLVKRKDIESQGVTKIRSLNITLRQLGAGDGHVTLKTYFISIDVQTKQKAITSENTQQAEATAGAGNTYTETSKPTVAYPSSVDPKTKKVIPAHGSKPVGWVVRVYQDNTLLTATASTPDMIDWLASH